MRSSNSLCHRKANHSATLKGDWGSPDPAGNDLATPLTTTRPSHVQPLVSETLRHPNDIETMAAWFMISADIGSRDGRVVWVSFKSG